AVATLVPIGVALGIPMPAGIRLLRARAPQMVTWAWGINGALSVVGATLAIFIAMNWGFGATLMGPSQIYLVGLAAMISAVYLITEPLNIVLTSNNVDLLNTVQHTINGWASKNARNGIARPSAAPSSMRRANSSSARATATSRSGRSPRRSSTARRPSTAT